MPRPLRPTGVRPEYLRECFDVLSDDPPILRWRTRALAHFADVENPEAALQQWRKTYAGQTIRPAADGRLRVPLRTDDGERRTLDARSIIAEVGVTPIGDMEGTPTITPNDRLRCDARNCRQRSARRGHADRQDRDRTLDGRPDGHERRHRPLPAGHARETSRRSVVRRTGRALHRAGQAHRSAWRLLRLRRGGRRGEARRRSLSRTLRRTRLSSTPPPAVRAGSATSRSSGWWTTRTTPPSFARPRRTTFRRRTSGRTTSRSRSLIPTLWASRQGLPTSSHVNLTD